MIVSNTGQTINTPENGLEFVLRNCLNMEFFVFNFHTGKLNLRTFEQELHAVSSRGVFRK